MTRETCIGIDLGTGFARVAVVGASGKPEVVPGPLGERALPATVGFARRRDGLPAIFVGTPARRQAVANSRHTVSGVKRLLGRRADDATVIRAASAGGYRVVAGPGGTVCVEIEGRPVSPEEIAAHLFAALKQAAEQHIGAHVDRAVLAVSAGAGHAERQAFRDAAEIAGLSVDRLISAPTATALSAAMARDPGTRQVVCDLGSGGLDVSIVNGEAGVLEVLAQLGDESFGGDLLDRRIVERLASELRGGSSASLDAESDPALHFRLRDEAERVKTILSGEVQTMLQCWSAQPASCTCACCAGSSSRSGSRI